MGVRRVGQLSAVGDMTRVGLLRLRVVGEGKPGGGIKRAAHEKGQAHVGGHRSGLMLPLLDAAIVPPLWLPLFDI